MKHFELANEYFTSVTVYTETKRFGDRTDLSNDELIELIKKGPIISTGMSSKDHPEFAKLREQLGEEGYIKIQHGWWNGDEVLKPFILNDMPFNVGDQFWCASAMKFHNERAI